MADISKIKYDGVTYDIKDATARATMSGAIKILGATTTALVDEATTNPITVNGQSVTAVANDAVFYNSKEFVFDGTYWHEFGDMTGLGDMAQHDLADVEFATTVTAPTASTTVSAPTASTTVSAPSASTTATSTDTTIEIAPAASGTATYTPAGTLSDTAIGVATTEDWANLAVSYGGTSGTDAETLIFTSTNKSAAKTVEVTTQPTFTGTGARLEGKVSIPTSFSTTVEAPTATTTVEAPTATTTVDAPTATTTADYTA